MPDWREEIARRLSLRLASAREIDIVEELRSISKTVTTSWSPVARRMRRLAAPC